VNRDYFLRTSRLGFRQWSADDLPLALALWGDPEVSRFLGGPFPPRAVERKLATEIENLQWDFISALNIGEWASP
jgi:RimJ/RimL family protein N-acetyltransferase